MLLFNHHFNIPTVIYAAFVPRGRRRQHSGRASKLGLAKPVDLLRLDRLDRPLRRETGSRRVRAVARARLEGRVD